MLKNDWNATQFFSELLANNKLAVTEGFTFCKVSGLEGFEEALAQMQTASAFVCVSDIADGYTELNNTPRTRRSQNCFPRHAPRCREIWKLAPSAWKPCANCSGSSPRSAYSGESRGSKQIAFTSTPVSSSTRLTVTFSPAAPALIFKSQSIATPI
jgi:hypothetical protein